MEPACTRSWGIFPHFLLDSAKSSCSKTSLGMTAVLLTLDAPKQDWEGYEFVGFFGP